MNDTICGKCGLDLSGPDAKLTLARCKDAECPIEKPRKRMLLPLLVLFGGSALVIGGTAAGISYLSAPPDTSERDAATAQRVAEKAKWAAAAKAATEVKIAKDGGTGIQRPAPNLKLQSADAKVNIENGPAFKGAWPTPDPLAIARVANFSCDSRVSPARALVCSDVQLAISDYNLSLLYKSVLASGANRGKVRSSQTEWIKRLDRYGHDKARVSALYRERFDALSLIQAGVA